MTSDVIINLRINKTEKERLTQIADVVGLSLSAFIRHAAIQQAHKVLGPPKIISTEHE